MYVSHVMCFRNETENQRRCVDDKMLVYYISMFVDSMSSGVKKHRCWVKYISIFRMNEPIVVYFAAALVAFGSLVLGIKTE